MSRLGQQLQRYGYKLTVPRQIVMDILAESSSHLSAEEIYLLAQKASLQKPSKKNTSVGPLTTGPARGIGLATVYRTLGLLTNLEIVDKRDFGDGCSRFELAGEGTAERHHHHLVCIKCGRVVEYNNFTARGVDFIERLKRSLIRRHKFKIIDHQLQFSGLCPKCQSEREL